MYEKIKKITSFIQSKVGTAFEKNGEDFSVKVGIVLGSGLGELADRISNPVFLPYEQIEGFPKSTVEGHKGQFVFGKLGGVNVVCMQGRFHFYEGYKIEDTVVGIRVMGMLGVKDLIVSNASGGVGDGFRVGDLMLIKDHINLLPNPLIGPNEKRWGERFVPMNETYSVELARLAKGCAKEMGVELKEGVYLASSGPSYETEAEYRFFKIVGADACGMSTVPEVIVAKHMGMNVLGFSVITNAPFAERVYTDHLEVQAVAAGVAKRLTDLVEKIVKERF